MGVIIRTMSENDKEAFINLSCSLTKFNYQTRPESERDYSLEERLIQRSENCNSTFGEFLKGIDVLGLIALSDNAPAGYAVAYAYPDRTGLLDELYVSENCRGNGIGKLLMEEASRWLKAKGALKVMIKVFDWNKDAKSFYEKEGCERSIITYSKKL